MRFTLKQSSRPCYLGHTDTFEIDGVDVESNTWLGDWTLWCRTCEALVADRTEVTVVGTLAPRKGVIGYVVSVPVGITILEDDVVEVGDDES